MYRVGIVGLGRIGAARSSPLTAGLGQVMPHSHMSAVAHSTNLKLTAVCDREKPQIDRFLGAWTSEAKDCAIYNDYRDLLSSEDIDILTVATPDDSHADIVAIAAQSGVRGILCEKPIATTLADADRMIDACKAHGVALVINHSRRWHPMHVVVRQLLETQAIGKVDHVVVRMGGPRAMLFRNGTHSLDGIGFFITSSPSWVAAWLDNRSSEYPPRYAGRGGTDPSLDPGVTAIIAMENGVRVLLHLSKDSAPFFEYDIVGSEGRVRLCSEFGELWTYLPSGEFSVRHLSAPLTTSADTFAAINEVVATLEGSVTTLSSSGETARQALAIMVACLQSGARGGIPIRFPITDV